MNAGGNFFVAKVAVILLLVSAVLMPLKNIRADVINVAVIYPEVREPFAAIYRDYIEGIRQKIDGQLWIYPQNGDGEDKLKSDIIDQKNNVYIGLGNKSTTLINELNPGKPIVAAVTSRKYESIISSGILLKPSAETYLTNLLDVISKTRRVFAVYNPEVDQSLIDEATAFLKSKNISFDAIPAKDIREAARGYRNIVKETEEYDSIWLMSDKSVLDSSLLSMVLDAAWDKKLAVFSSNPVFVRHGALFAIYPDNKGVGYTLGMMANATMNAKNTEFNGLEPLKDVRVAMNERTRNHLGVQLSPALKDKVDLTLPGN